MFHNNIVKISEKVNKQNLLKICLQVTFSFNFTMGKSENIGFFKKNWLE